MTENTILLEKREELKSKLMAGEYKTLVDLMLDGTVHFAQKLSRKSRPPSLWYSALVIALLVLLIVLVVSIVLGESDLLGTEGILRAISVVGNALVGLIILKLYIDNLFAFFHDHHLFTEVTVGRVRRFAGGKDRLVQFDADILTRHAFEEQSPGRDATLGAQFGLVGIDHCRRQQLSRLGRGRSGEQRRHDGRHRSTGYFAHL